MLRTVLRILLSWIWVMGIIKTAREGLGYLILYLILSVVVLLIVEARRGK
jgi:hypothetical protein